MDQGSKAMNTSGRFLADTKFTASGQGRGYWTVKVTDTVTGRESSTDYIYEASALKTTATALAQEILAEASGEYAGTKQIRFDLPGEVDGSEFPDNVVEDATEGGASDGGE